MTKKRAVLFVIAINLVIALAFFVKNLGVGYSRLSSDQHNIVAMCLKLDQPTLFQGDVFLNDTQNFQYYIPFFIKFIRSLASVANGDYIMALNIGNSLAHVIFGISWFLLCYHFFKKRFWLSIGISILMRGIVWLPGNEFWGISDLWAFTPRTLYAALLPLPFLLLYAKVKYRFIWANLLLGVLLNVHPISGIGGILLFYSLVLGNYFFYKKKESFGQLSIGAGTLLLGMTPFLMTYLLKIDLEMTYDKALYEAAFLERLPAIFQDPVLFVKMWWAPKSLFFVLPLLGLYLIGFLYNKKYLKYALHISVMVLVVGIVPVLFFPLEQWLNETMNTNLRMAFQLIRIQKMIILPMYFSIGFLLLYGIERFQKVAKFFPYAVGIYLCIVLWVNPNSFKGVPLLSDDITTSIFPSWKDLCTPRADRLNNFDRMAQYIEKETPQQALFYHHFKLRAAASRSVLLDVKGPGMLIEGNPAKLVEWYKDKKELDALRGAQRWEFLKSKGIEYMLMRKVLNYPHLEEIHKEGPFVLYKLR